MFDNRYDGVLEKWKLRLICRRARRMGFRGFDLDDVQQQVVLALLDFQFDAAKSNGASEMTAITAVIDRQLAMIRRSESRARQRLEIAKDGYEEGYEAADVALSLDVESVVQSLPELDRQICRGLSLGHSVNQLADSLGVGWHAVRNRVDAIRRHFEEHGLPEPFISDRRTAEI